MKIPVIIDTDIGDDIDDSFALCLAMQSPELEVLGVTTVFRCAKERAKIAKKLLTEGGRGDIPVHAGESRPLSTQVIYGRPINFNQLPQLYGEEFEDTRYEGDDAVEFIAKTLMSHPQKVTIVTLGALTNIASVLKKYPEAASRIEKLYIMGGAYLINLGEFNFSCDPEAADIVISSSLPKVCVGIDITFKCKFDGEYLDKLMANKHPCIRLLMSMNKRWGGHIFLHDPLALMMVFNPQFVKFERRLCKVEHHADYANGYVVNLSDFNWNESADKSDLYVGVEVDSKAFIEEYYNRIKNFS